MTRKNTMDVDLGVHCIFLSGLSLWPLWLEAEKDHGSADDSVPYFWSYEVGGMRLCNLLPERGERRVARRGETWWSPQFSFHPVHV